MVYIYVFHTLEAATSFMHYFTSWSIGPILSGLQFYSQPYRYGGMYCIWTEWNRRDTV